MASKKKVTAKTKKSAKSPAAAAKSKSTSRPATSTVRKTTKAPAGSVGSKPTSKAKKSATRGAAKPAPTANAAKARSSTKPVKPAQKGAAKAKASAKEASRGSTPPRRKPTDGGRTSTVVQAILLADAPQPLVVEQGNQMLNGGPTAAVQAARVLQEVLEQKPELVVPLAERFVRGLTSKHKRVVQTSAEALPVIARIAPAKVARHLELLKASYEPAIWEGRDGLVRTFAALCTASVAYQKRLEPSLTTALEGADGKTLLRWSQVVLPALKGEPHARARGVVEARLYRIPRAIAQQIADFLKIKLRVRY